MKKFNIDELLKAGKLLTPNQPLIVMSFRPSLIGVFTNEDALQNALNKKSITSVYTPLNEVKKDVLESLPKNEFGKMKSGCGISGKDIKHLSHFFVDVDVVGLQNNGAKRNATEEEHEEARKVAFKAKEFLLNAGFPNPILIDSANGYHLLYQIDMNATKQNEKIICNALKALAENVDSEGAKIDTVVHDRGRKIKLPGSSNNADEEDYRMATIIEIPQENTIVLPELIEGVAKLCKSKKDGWKNSKGMMTIEEGFAELAEQAGEYFVSDTRQFFANIHVHDGKTITYNLRDDEFRYHMRRLFKDVLKVKIIDARDWSGLLEYLEVLATSNRQNVKIYNRIGCNEEGILYDLINNEFESVLITEEGYSIINTPAGVFQRNSTDLPQIEPIFDQEFDFWGTMESLFNFKNEEELQLFVLWLVSAYIPDICKPILLITGPHGSSKSTACSMIQELISPQAMFRSTFPRKTDDLAVRLANRALCVYDNCSKISPEQSDLLCSCSTGGSYEKRKLYTDSQLINIPLKSSVVLNSCETLIERPDLLSRTLQFNMATLSGEQLLSDDEMKRRFDKAKPYLLGSIFMFLCYYLAEKDSLEGEEINYIVRMTEFQKSAMIIGKSAFGMSYEYIENLLINNKKNINIQVLETNPVSFLILTFMKDKETWSGSVTELYDKLDLLAFQLGIEKGNKLYPRHAASLSMRLNSLTSMLEQAGITFHIKPSATYKKITIKNKNSILKKKRKRTDEFETDIDKELGI